MKGRATRTAEQTVLISP